MKEKEKKNSYLEFLKNFIDENKDKDNKKTIEEKMFEELNEMIFEISIKKKK